MDTIIISDDDDDQANTSIQVLGQFIPSTPTTKQDKSIIDLTDIDEAQPDSSSSGPLIPPPTPSPPPSQPSSLPPTPRGKSSPSSSVSPIKPSSQPNVPTPRVRNKKRPSDELLKQARRKNRLCNQNENCLTKISSNILSILDDPEQDTFGVLFSENSLNYSIEDGTKDTVTWTYKHTEVEGLHLVEKYRDCHWTIVVIHGSDYLKRILAYKNNPSDSQSLKTYICDILERNAKDSKSNIILLVYRLADVLRSERLKEAKNYRKNFKDRFESNNINQQSTNNTQPILCIGPQDLQDLRLTLEIDVRFHHPEWKMHVEFHEKTEEAVNSIMKYTFSVAKANRCEVNMNELGVDWAIQADKERAVDPTRSIEDLKKLWIRQLQQFTSITLPIANAIANEYPSPLALLDQYKQMNRSEAETLLAEIYVQKNFRRQVGQNVSRRIHCFMTSKDPNVRIAYGEDFLESGTPTTE